MSSLLTRTLGDPHAGWRTRFAHASLAQRLAESGCPVSFAVALETANEQRGPLTEWARLSLAEGVMLRTAQAELIAHGSSLEQTARLTLGGKEPDLVFVLYTLTRLEIEERPRVGEFYNGTGSLQEVSS